MQRSILASIAAARFKRGMPITHALLGSWGGAQVDPHVGLHLGLREEDLALDALEAQSASGWKMELDSIKSTTFSTKVEEDRQDSPQPNINSNNGVDPEGLSHPSGYPKRDYSLQACTD